MFSSQLLFRLPRIPLLLLCNVPKLISLSCLALPSPGSLPCHISHTQLVPVACRKPLALPRLVTVSWKALLSFPPAAASADAAPSAVPLGYQLATWQLPIGTISKNSFFFLKSPDKVAKFN